MSKALQQHERAAVHYVNTVRRIFCHEVRPPQPHVYEDFVKCLQKHKRGTSTEEVIEAVIQIFLGRQNARELIEGFNAFLPPGYRVDFPAHAFAPSVICPVRPGPMNLETHCRFVAAVKNTFAPSQPVSYRQFCELVQRFRDRPEATQQELNLHTAVLFEGHEDKLQAIWEQCGCAGERIRSLV